MSFEEFQSLARMYVVGALDEDELGAFEAARQEHGAEAEKCIAECERLASAFALSLQPQKPAPDARQELLARIAASEPKPKRRWFH
jgi:anti-sigma-K factor RskA